MEYKRVVVTGIGVVTASGGREDTWKAVMEGRSPACRFRSRDMEFAGCSINGGNSGLDLIIKCAVKEAIDDSGRVPDERIYSTISVSKPDLSSFLMSGDFRKLFNSYGVSRALCELGIECEQQVLSAACSTGMYSIINACRIIRRGVSKRCLAGSGETPFNGLYYSGFRNMGVLAEETMRPYDKKRDGFILGEGAGIIVLEELEHAVSRGARIYAEISGGEMSFDPEGMFKFEKNSCHLASALERLKKNAGMKADDGIYVNSHGTATAYNDIMETNSLKKVFGKNAYNLKISSTKPVTGHLLGGSGAVGVCVCILALRDQFVPPTINLSDADPECDLNYVPRKGCRFEMENAVSISMGFGGHIGTVAVRRFNG